MNTYFEKRLEQLIFTEVDSDEKFILTERNLANYPPYLYKYRDCNEEYNFEMIEEGYLWADKPENYIDPIDSKVNLKLKSEIGKIQKWIFQHLGELLYYNISPKGMPPHKNGFSLKSYKDAQAEFTDSKGRYSAKRAKRLMLVEMKKLSQKKQKEVEKVFKIFESEDFETKVLDAIKSDINKVRNCLRESYLVCCLTQRKDNQKMWEDYADKYSGFVIEYDLSRVVDHKDVAQMLSRTFPVTYYQRMPKVPLLPFIEQSYYKKLYDKDIDIRDALKKLYKQLFIKKAEYNSEEEWRIISNVQKIKFPTISAIYMGYKIDFRNEERLRKACMENGIRLYKQKLNLFGDGFSFECLETEKGDV